LFANLIFNFGTVSTLSDCKLDGTEDIRISFREQGYWSFLGTDSLTVADKEGASFSLQQLGDDLLPLSLADARSVTLHNFGHAIGLEHQHQNPQGKCEAEYDKRAIQEWQSKSNISTLISSNDLRAIDGFDPAIAYDSKSIMHYSLPATLFKRGKQSHCWTEGNSVLSEGDKRVAAAIYPSQKIVEARAKLATEFTDLLKRGGFSQAEIDTLGANFKERLEVAVPATAR
jgi:hypothetical protein